MGIGGGTLLSGWRGTLVFKRVDLRFADQRRQVGLARSRLYISRPVRGTGPSTGSIRPDYTGAARPQLQPPGFFPEPGLAVCLHPLTGQWANSGEELDQLVRPQFVFERGALGRTFRVRRIVLQWPTLRIGRHKMR